MTGTRPREGGRSIQGTLQEALFDPLADCPTRARYERTAEGARKGWASQAIKLKCLDCSGWTYREAKECEIRTCALWLLNRRIFKGRGAAVEELNTPKEGEAA